MDRSSLNSKDLLKNNMFKGYDSMNIAQDTEKNLNKLIGSHSTESLAKIRTSRMMLNKHLEEQNKHLRDTEKDRRMHVDKFHSALKNTGQSLDHLTRRMQFDIYRSKNESAIPIQPDIAVSLIEHELAKSKFLDQQSSKLISQDKQMKQNLNETIH